MSPIRLLRPSIGNTSPIESSTRKIATNASICGKIWMISSDVRPPCRPWNRKRENAYAAAPPMRTVPIAVTVQTTMELANQSPYPRGQRSR